MSAAVRWIGIAHVGRRFAAFGACVQRRLPTRPDVSAGDRPRSASRIGPADRWQRSRQLLGALFMLAVAGLMIRYAMTVDWRAALQSLRRYDARTLALAALCAGGSHVLYACTDLFARPIIGNRVSRPRSMTICFVCYAFNLTMGTWIGSIGLRYRLYSRDAIGAEEIARVIALGLVTNWSGYLLLAGSVFALGTLQLPAAWALGALGLRVLGGGMLAVLLIGLGFSAFSRKREWTLFGRRGRLPDVRRVVMQLLVSTSNWLLVASLLFVLLRAQIDYLTVLAVFLISAIAGAAAHVPAGLGVTEGVFFALLGSRLPQQDLLAALIAYRLLFQLAPLLLAVLVLTRLEFNAGSRLTGKT